MYIVPKFLGQPLSFLGMELDEIILIYIVAFYSYVADSLPYFLCLMAVVVWFIRVKRRNPQGFFKHSLYFLSLFSLDRYPEYTENEFLE